jgi:hypothetical protein
VAEKENGTVYEPPHQKLKSQKDSDKKKKNTIQANKTPTCPPQKRRLYILETKKKLKSSSVKS